MSDFLDEKETVETNANSQGVIDELERQKEIKKKTWKICLIVVAVFTVLMFGITLISILTMDSDSEKNDDAGDTYYEEQYEEENVVDNSVNGKGYYYFDNGLEETIDKYRNIVEQTDESTLENSIDNITTDKFTTSRASFLGVENVTEYFYQYHNKYTGVMMYCNESGEIPMFTFLHTPEIPSGYTNSAEAQAEQFIWKPAKWLCALSDDLTLEEAGDIYATLWRDVTESDESRTVRVSSYYKGYTIMIQGDGSTFAFSVVKSDSDFASKNGIYAGGSSVLQPIN